MIPFLMLAILAGGAPQNDPRGRFDEAFRAADGPASLRELETWCARHHLKEEQARVANLLASLAPPRLAADHASREAARARRHEALKAVREFQAGRTRAMEEALRNLLGWMRQERFAPPEARSRLEDLARRFVATETAAADLGREIASLDHAPGAPEQEQKRAAEFARRLAAALRNLSDRLFVAADRCAKAGEPGYAFDLYHHLLCADPDNERARRSLGQLRLGDRWLRPYDLEQARAGLAWDDRFSWILPREKARYERGEAFDLASRRWAPIEDLDRRHSRVENPWRVRSEHFDVLSTADLAATADLVSKLEAFFLQAFRRYDLFFAGGKCAQLVFGVAPARKPLRVHFYRDADQFRSHARPPAEWAAGFYDPMRRTSFFYALNGAANLQVLRHELTHQILWEFGGGGDAPQWLAEGAAVGLEEEGPPSLSRAYGDNLKAGMPEIPFRDVTRLQTFEDWVQGDVQRNYRGAGAAFAFLMEMDGGRYRGDLIEMLRDAYAGRLRPIEDYFGLSARGLEILMERFYRKC